jgi:cell division protein ZapA (FtsZ GTPase activity inhibitor)
MSDDKTITIDGKNYTLDQLNENARAQLANLRFVDERLQQLKNELAIADTARLAYSAALKREIEPKA